MAEVKIKVGKESPKGKVDQAKIGKGKKPARSGSDVEGQYQYWDWVSCPYCWAVNEVVVDTQVWLAYSCWNCGGTFEV